MNAILNHQHQVYDLAYSGRQRVRRILRFDVRYRRQRLHEVLVEHGLSVAGARVLDVGFGGGDLLASFPASCSLHGVEISRTAVETARADARFSRFREANFTHIEGDTPEALPRGPFDVILASHVLEHVGDDRCWVEALQRRLRPGGIILVFVPIEEPNYNPDHVRVYSIDSITGLLRNGGLEVLHSEGGLHLNGHLWKFLTIPSRRRWPVLGSLVNTLRLLSQALVPYRLTRTLETLADRLGLGPRQALCVAVRR